MLMMLACGVVLAKCWAADAHDAGLWRASGKSTVQLMLACSVLLGKNGVANVHDAAPQRASGKKLCS